MSNLEKTTIGLAIAAFVLPIFGYWAGVSSRANVGNDAFISQANNMGRAQQDANQLTQLKIENARLQTISKALEARTQTCEANFSTFTVLYEPGTSLSIPLLHGLVDLQAGAVTGLQSPAHPAWVIPAKIEPRVIASQAGLVYGYIDRQNGQIDGPYPATVIAAGDKFGVAGWAPR